MPLLFHPADPTMLLFATNVLWKTNNGGEQWQIISPDLSREQPEVPESIGDFRTPQLDSMPRRGVIYAVAPSPREVNTIWAGTERAVYFSVDDGEHWQSLRMNMPASSIRDLVIHEHDLVIGTHGRAIWILDNFAPLREMVKAAAAPAHLFAPPQARRVRWNMFSDTPLPPEEPAGQNPPDGAVHERPLEVRLDPRVTLSPAEVQLQTDYALACYHGYLRLQKIREAIDALLQNRTALRNQAQREASLRALRGAGVPGNPDLLYGSITATSADQETIVGLQNKFLFLLNLLQGAEARPTQQAMAGVRALQEMLEAVARKWEALR